MSVVSSLLGPGPGSRGGDSGFPPPRFLTAVSVDKAHPTSAMLDVRWRPGCCDPPSPAVRTSPGPVVPRGALCCVGGEGMGAEEGS